jgi:hypothetical protein
MAKTKKRIKVQWEFEKSDDAETRIEAVFDLLFSQIIDDEVSMKDN